MNEIPYSVLAMLASREHRMHHYLWHQVRNTWNQLSAEDKESIARLGWKPPRPSLKENGKPNPDNNSGLDFLYMHMKMVEWVNEELKKVDAAHPGIISWKNIPGPTNKTFPVPEGEAREKTTEFYERIKITEAQFKDSTYLSTLTVAELGTEIEFSIHNWLHVRWADENSEERPDINPKNPQIDVKWDAASYNNLGDTYSSHVNPIFWSLHGWVNDRIQDWQKANPGKKINWPTDWQKNEMNFSTAPTNTINSSFSHEHHSPNMIQVLEILAKSGHCKDFYSQFPSFDPTQTSPEEIASAAEDIKTATNLTPAEKRTALKSLNSINQPSGPATRAKIQKSPDTSCIFPGLRNILFWCSGQKELEPSTTNSKTFIPSESMKMK